MNKNLCALCPDKELDKFVYTETLRFWYIFEIMKWKICKKKSSWTLFVDSVSTQNILFVETVCAGCLAVWS